jgi:hypothetical protein
MVMRIAGPARRRSVVSHWRIWPVAFVAAAACIVDARGQNLDEGKTGPQLFALDCVACHRSPQGLAKNHSGWSLTSFLRQHYTSSSNSASVLAAYLTSGANARAADQKKKDDRQAKQTSPKDARPGDPATQAQPSAQQGGQQPPRKQREAARPGEPGTEVPGRANRKTRREAEAVPMPPPEPTASVAATGTTPEEAPNPFAAGSANVVSAAQSAASATAQPGFGDPLP